jgi:hypothetical protein
VVVHPVASVSQAESMPPLILGVAETFCTPRGVGRERMRGRMILSWVHGNTGSAQRTHSADRVQMADSVHPRTWVPQRACGITRWLLSFPRSWSGACTRSRAVEAVYRLQLS